MTTSAKRAGWLVFLWAGGSAVVTTLACTIRNPVRSRGPEPSGTGVRGASDTSGTRVSPLEYPVSSVVASFGLSERAPRQSPRGGFGLVDRLASGCTDRHLGGATPGNSSRRHAKVRMKWRRGLFPLLIFSVVLLAEIAVGGCSSDVADPTARDSGTTEGPSALPSTAVQTTLVVPATVLAGGVTLSFDSTCSDWVSANADSKSVFGAVVDASPDVAMGFGDPEVSVGLFDGDCTDGSSETLQRILINLGYMGPVG